MAESDDRIRPGRLLLLGALLAVVFLLLFVLVAAKVAPVVWDAVRGIVGSLVPLLPT